MDYLPQKAKKITPEERLQKQLDFEQKMKQLKNAPVEMSGELSSKMTKDLPVEHIDKLQSAPLKKADDAMAQIAAKRAAKVPAAEYVYDAGKEKADYIAKMRAEKRGGLAKTMAGAKKGLGKLGMTLGPIGAIGGALMAGSADEALANAVVPGGIEGLGQGSDQMLTPEQEQSVEASRELTGGEPMNQARFRALQKMVGR
jgi:hypothetical protein